MSKRRSAHLTRLMIESMSNFSPYRQTTLRYKKDFDPTPLINIAHVEKMDIERAIKILFKQGELSEEEVMMLAYVQADGRLSRRDISKLIQEDYGFFVDQRTISRRLNSAYEKIQSFLGPDYGDERVIRMVGRARGYPEPYLLPDAERENILSIWERL